MKGLQGKIFSYMLMVISNFKSSLKAFKVSSTVWKKITVCTCIIGRVALENKSEKTWCTWFLNKREVTFVAHLNK